MKDRPLTGTMIHLVKLIGGKIQVDPPHPVGNYLTFSLCSDEFEWFGSRINVKELYPCMPIGLPNKMPLSMSDGALPCFWVKTEDLEIAKLRLLKEFGEAALQCAAEAEKLVATLRKQVINMG